MMAYLEVFTTGKADAIDEWTPKTWVWVAKARAMASTLAGKSVVMMTRTLVGILTGMFVEVTSVAAVGFVSSNVDHELGHSWEGLAFEITDRSESTLTVCKAKSNCYLGTSPLYGMNRARD